MCFVNAKVLVLVWLIANSVESVFFSVSQITFINFVNEISSRHAFSWYLQLNVHFGLFIITLDYVIVQENKLSSTLNLKLCYFNQRFSIVSEWCYIKPTVENVRLTIQAPFYIFSTLNGPSLNYIALKICVCHGDHPSMNSLSNFCFPYWIFLLLFYSSMKCRI